MSGKFPLLGYNSSRKHISISIPASTEVMSPHIRSVDELRVLGLNLSSFNTPTQFMVCVAGIFLFYLIYGYLQVSRAGLIGIISSGFDLLLSESTLFIWSIG